MMKLLLTGFILLLFTCNDSEPVAEEQSVANEEIAVEETQQPEERDTDEEAFLLFYKNFTQALISKNTDTINTFINTINGVYFIESNGAMPIFSKHYGVEKFKSVLGKPFTELKFKLIDLEPVFEDLPKVVCNETRYDKDGCFADKTNPFVDNEIWYYTDLNEKDKQAISVIAKTIVYTVVNTSNYVFYFSETEEGLKLSFIDLRVPCEA